MPRWFAALFAVFCLACTGLVSATAVADRVSQPGLSAAAAQSSEASVAIESTTFESEAGADATDIAPDLPDLISTPRFVAVPMMTVGSMLDGRGNLPPSPHLALPQRPPRSGTISA